MAALLWLGLGLVSATHAACPAIPAGGEAPPQAHAEFLDNAPWRARVAELDRELADFGRLEARGSEARLLFLGDSITEAWDHDLFAGHFARYGALNLGVRGDTTQGMLWRLPRLGLGSRLAPRLIVLLIGTNNTWPDGNAEAVAIGIAQVVRAIRALAPTSRILLVGILPRGSDTADPWRRMGIRVNRLIAACADGRAVFFIEPGAALVDARGQLPVTLAADYLHPTQQGYAILSDAIAKEVGRLLAP